MHKAFTYYITKILTLQMQAESEEAVDSAGVAGWDKVDALADALLSLQGLSVTNKQAENIRSLYTQLLEFDKRPIVFRPQQVRPSRGRFARKKRTGFRGVEAMKRYAVCILHH